MNYLNNINYLTVIWLPKRQLWVAVEGTGSLNWSWLFRSFMPDLWPEANCKSRNEDETKSLAGKIWGWTAKFPSLNLIVWPIVPSSLSYCFVCEDYKNLDQANKAWSVITLFYVFKNMESFTTQIWTIAILS